MILLAVYSCDLQGQRFFNQDFDGPRDHSLVHYGSTLVTESDRTALYKVSSHTPGAMRISKEAMSAFSCTKVHLHLLVGYNITAAQVAMEWEDNDT